MKAVVAAMVKRQSRNALLAARMEEFVHIDLEDSCTKGSDGVISSLVR